MALKSSLVSQAPSPNGRAALWRRDHNDKQSRRPWRQCRRDPPFAPIWCATCSATASPGLRRLERYSDSLPFLHHAHRAGKAVFCAPFRARKYQAGKLRHFPEGGIRQWTTFTLSRRSRKSPWCSTPRGSGLPWHRQTNAGRKRIEAITTATEISISTLQASKCDNSISDEIFVRG